MPLIEARSRGIALGILLTLAAPAAADTAADTAAPPPAPAAADKAPDYFAAKPHGAIRIRRKRERCRADRMLIGGLLAGAAVTTGAGVYFHLDSRAAAEELSAKRLTNLRWSEELAETYDRGQRSGTLARVSYGLAGALAIGTLVAVWLTDPGEEVVELRVRASATVTDDGASVGAAWQF
jgi:hypothetical protein